MQKKLIALAVAAAVAAPMAASAAPTIYGKLHTSFDWIDDDDDGDGDDFVTGTFRASRLGFKGSESLGGSLKAIWQVETQVNPSDNSDTGGDLDLRNTFVGLSGNWGTVLLGRHDTPYKIATGKLDGNADRIGDYNNIIGNANGQVIYDERAPQTIAYITPNFNGFHAAAAYIEHKFNEERSTIPPGDNSGNRGCVPSAARVDNLGRFECDNDDENRAWSAMAMWESGNWFLSGAWERHYGYNFQAVTGQDNPSGDDWIQAFKAGLGYKFGNWKLAGVIEKLDDDEDDTEYDRVAGYGAVSYKFGRNVIKASYGRAGDSDDETCGSTGDRSCDDNAANYTLSLDHNFSKRTTVYATFSYMDNDEDGTYGLNPGSQIGDGYRAKNPGDDPRSGSIGIIHKF